MNSLKVIKLKGNPTQWTSKLRQANCDYKFQPVLTNKLDNNKEEFTEQTLLEIVLWKTNRFPDLNNNLINQINSLRKKPTIEKGRDLLKHMLDLKGFDLPMASTVLRFARPDLFQIIDQRVYRIINEEDKMKMPYNKEKKVDFYFKYLNLLKEKCIEFDIPFERADRILYQLDKMENKNISIKY